MRLRLSFRPEGFYWFGEWEEPRHPGLTIHLKMAVTQLTVVMEEIPEWEDEDGDPPVLVDK